ncbi:MAG: aldehyde ferredoxin oxidoreductase C-terminal domain-containing protein, partial [Dehalococcoidia bacterium]
LSAVCGWDYSTDELLETGDRIANLRHAFNLREGLNPLEFQVPGRVLGRPPLAEGPTAGVEIDLDALEADYLRAMSWDPVTARPSRQRLVELGLKDVDQALQDKAQPMEAGDTR